MTETRYVIDLGTGMNISFVNY